MPHRARSAFLALLAAAALLGTGCARHTGSGRTPASPAVTGSDIARGKAVYEQQCAACHGAAGGGGEIGPALRGERLRKPYDAVRAIVADPQPPMPKLYPGTLTQADVRDVSAYVESL